MKDISVGLFGTCDDSKWREPFIECYEASKIDYFNPDAGDNWHPGMIEDENWHLRECELMTCTKEEIPLIREEHIFVRMDYSVPVFRTEGRTLESII